MSYESNDKQINNNSGKAGYTRIKSGDIKRRNVSRTPDMSRPTGRVANPNVALGSVPATRKPTPVASLHVEPEIQTITSTKKVSFPYTIVFLSLICSVLFMYMIFNFVQINEHTASVADLKSEVSTLKAEEKDLNAKLELKNDPATIERIAKEEYGMVKLEEISRQYIEFGSKN